MQEICFYTSVLAAERLPEEQHFGWKDHEGNISDLELCNLCFLNESLEFSAQDWDKACLQLKS